MFSAPVLWFCDRVDRVRCRLDLTATGLATVALSLVLLAFTLVLFGGVSEDVTQHNGLATTDALHLRWFTQHRSDVVVAVGRVVSEIGSPAVLAAFAIFAAVVLWLRGTRLGLAIAPGIALGVAAIVAGACKAIVARNRPPVSLHLVSETNPSFPSGHATDSTALFVTLALVAAVFVFRRPLARCMTVASAGIVAAVIGISRLMLGVHWPTDVLAGWTLGLAVALAVTTVAAFVTRSDSAGFTRQGNSFARIVRVLSAERQRPPTLQAA